MKLIRQITMALILGAIPAMALSQTVSCEACTHDVSVYMGNGGLIAEADGADMVAWVATCGGVTHHGELEPNAAGMVMLQFTDSGLVCNAEESRLQIGPVKDGGWFWITDDTNSAVGSLVSHDILDNAETGITNAGPGVTMTMGRGAVLLKEASTGRVGLLPNILPAPPAATLRKCGYDDGGAGASPRYTRRSTDCALGDGGAIVLATTTDPITGVTVRIPDGGTVVRPAGDGTITIIADLWMNGSGHYRTDADLNPKRGHQEFAMTATRAEDRLNGGGYRVRLDTGPAASTVLLTVSSPVAGVSYTDERAAATISIVADSAYCSRTSNFSLPVTVTSEYGFLPNALAHAASVTPSVRLTGAFNDAGTTTFTVVCP